jgi:hypothetical protein
MEGNTNELLDNMVNPQALKEQMEGALQKLNPLMVEFKRSYISHFLNPSYDEGSNLYSQTQAQITSFSSEIFENKNNTHGNTEQINRYLLFFNKEIIRLREENRKLKRKYTHLHEVSDTSIERIGDYQTLYEIQYLKNWALLLSLIAAGVAMNIVFAPTIQ